MYHNDEISIPLMKIYTLGDFDLSINNQSFFRESSRKHKIIKLFQYLLTFRGKKLLPETIIENLEPGNEYNDPNNVLRTQIFRLRKTLMQFAGDLRQSGSSQPYYCRIVFSRGYYILELSEHVILDVDEFDKLVNLADQARRTNPDEAIKLYKKAVDLYKGDYLSGCNCDTWVVPVRNHYNRVYLQALFSLIELSTRKRDYSQIIDTCEKALLIEPYEEALHISYLEALLEAGLVKHALSHYGYVISHVCKELGVRPSWRLQSIHRKIQSSINGNSDGEMNLRCITELLMPEDYGNGAVFCDLDHFRLLYDICHRNSSRNEIPACICLVTLIQNNLSHMPVRDQDSITESLKKALRFSLRKGDVFAMWNDTQAVALLSAVKSDGYAVIEKRIRKNFSAVPLPAAFSLSIQFQPVTSHTDLLYSDTGRFRNKKAIPE
jgi:two-component SAPR family response regulator